MGNYTYDAGNIREHKTAIALGDKVRVEKERYVEWTQMSGSVSSSETLVASGNKQFADVVKKLYMNCSPDSLVDIEELEYPLILTRLITIYLRHRHLINWFVLKLRIA